MIIEPRIQMTNMGQMKLPHCTLKLATVSGAKNRRTQIPKLDGFQRCRPFTLNTYFEAIEITLQSG